MKLMPVPAADEPPPGELGDEHPARAVAAAIPAPPASSDRRLSETP
jgi:hypothetical protein